MIDDTGIGTDKCIYNKLYCCIRNEYRDDHNGLHCLSHFFKYELINSNCQYYIEEGSQCRKHNVIQQGISRHGHEGCFGSKKEFEVINSIPGALPNTQCVVKVLKRHYKTSHRDIHDKE